MNIFSHIIQSFLAVFGGVVTVNAVILTLTTNMNLGNILQHILGISLLLYGIFFKKIKEKFPVWIKATYFSVIGIFIICSLSIILYGSFDTVTYKEDVLIVLGAGINGEKPGATLKTRLDKAILYHSKNPDALIIVSGGKGTDERLSEAEVMKRYLEQNGVDKSVIIKEDRSTSTKENFEFSKKITDEIFEKNYTVAYITNEFHIFRAGCFSKHAGFENTAHLHSNSRIGGLLSSCLREELAILKLWIIGR